MTGGFFGYDGMQEAGNKTISFSASHLASGVSMDRITARPFAEVKKMVLLRERYAPVKNEETPIGINRGSLCMA